jgi:hypothetical protein
MSVFRWFVIRIFFWNRPISHQVSLGSQLYRSVLKYLHFHILFSQIWLTGFMDNCHPCYITQLMGEKKCSQDIKTWPENLNVSQTIFMERNFPPNPWGFWPAEYVLLNSFIPASISVYRTPLATLPPPSRYPRHLVHSCFFLQLKQLAGPTPRRLQFINAVVSRPLRSIPIFLASW